MKLFGLVRRLLLLVKRGYGWAHALWCWLFSWSSTFAAISFTHDAMCAWLTKHIIYIHGHYRHPTKLSIKTNPVLNFLTDSLLILLMNLALIALFPYSLFLANDSKNHSVQTLGLRSKHRIFTNTQYGFISSHSTELAHLEQKEFIIQSMENKHSVLNLFINFRSLGLSFTQILIHKTRGFRRHTPPLLLSYLGQRGQYFEINIVPSSAGYLVLESLRGVFLHLFFNISINDIIHTTLDAKFIIYTDDKRLLFSGPDEAHLVTSAKEDLLELKQWSKKNTLTVKVSKIKAMFYMLMILWTVARQYLTTPNQFRL